MITRRCNSLRILSHLEFYRHCTTSQSEVRVRFAPSPTGSLHLGSLRTALFNYLFAKHYNGKFILRVDDTDQKRVVPGAMKEHLRTLDYFLLYRDEDPIKGGPYGPYIQSQRLDIYQKAAEQLIASGHAYHCFCSEDRLELLRKNAVRMRQIPRYDNKCRANKPEDVKARVANGEKYVVRLKIDHETIHFNDITYGDTQYEYNEGDFILLKSDGYPIYHFSTVVDDYYMKISHVIRGWEWLASTAKHVKLFQAFHWSPPKWIHLPLITADGKQKLSKRREDAFVTYYVDTKGYLPLAVINFLTRNGSGIRDFEENRLYTMEQLVDRFDENLLNRRNFMMDEHSLNNYGKLAFRKADFHTELLPMIRDRIHHLLPDTHPDLLTDKYIQSVVHFLKFNEEKFTTLEQLTKGDFKFFFGKLSSAEKVLAIYDKNLARKIFETILNLQKNKQEPIDVDDFEKLQHEFKELTKREFFRLIRLALIDSESGPPVAELLDFFGPKETFDRFETCYRMLS